MAEPIKMPLERRRHPRTLVQMTLRGVRLDPEEGELIDTLHMVDISRAGMGALLDRGVYRGQRFVLCLPVSGQTGRRNIYATVVRCRATEDGYRVGLQFDSASVGAWCGVAATVTAAAA